MLCWFLLYGRVVQLYIYTYTLFFRFPSHLGHHGALSCVPCAVRQVLISCLFFMWWCIYVDPNLPVRPTPLFPLGNCKFVFYICRSISPLQISSSVPFLQIPHISDMIRYFQPRKLMCLSRLIFSLLLLNKCAAIYWTLYNLDFIWTLYNFQNTHKYFAILVDTVLQIFPQYAT